MSTADRARFAQTIRAQSERLAEMIDKLLALAAVEHRQRLDARERVDLVVLVDEALAHCASRLADVDVSAQRTGDPQAWVEGDPFLLRQAIVNLVENAAAFSPSGATVDVAVARRGDAVELIVSDRGTGVPDYALPRVFERFYSLPRPEGGSRSSGLGLCFVAEVAALHDGAASLDNRTDGGASATLRLPAA